MKVFVGNLPVDTSDQDQLGLFRPFGEALSANVVKTRYSGRSRRFGYVEMLPEYGERAASALNGQQIDCMRLRVNQASD